MIARLRRRHRWTLLLLGAALLALFALALDARPRLPRAERLPAAAVAFPDAAEHRP